MPGSLGAISRQDQESAIEFWLAHFFVIPNHQIVFIAYLIVLSHNQCWLNWHPLMTYNSLHNTPSKRLRGRPQENAHVLHHFGRPSTWILKTHFFENWSQKTQPSRFHVDGKSTYFLKRWRHRPTPWPLACDHWTPQCLITTTTTMADYMTFTS